MHTQRLGLAVQPFSQQICCSQQEIGVLPNLLEASYQLLAADQPHHHIVQVSDLQILPTSQLTLLSCQQPLAQRLDLGSVSQLQLCCDRQ